MSMRRAIFVMSGILLPGLLAGLVDGGAMLFTGPHRASAAAAHLAYHAMTNGPYRVQGNMIIGGDGRQYIFHGISRDGMEYSCDGAGPMDRQHLAYMGLQQNGPGGTYWGANTVRLPLSENLWLHGSADLGCTSSHYQSVVKQTVDTLTALNLNVMLDLQWADAGGQSGRGGATTAMPDADSVSFWHQMSATYRQYSTVLFELYNEPHPGSWDCWRSGCQITNDTIYSDDCHCMKSFSYQAVGMQSLVDAVRGAGAKNIVIVAGMNWGYDLSQVPTYRLTGENIVYDTHPYPYYGKEPQDWDSHFGNLTATYPIISAESGVYDCSTGYMSQLLNYFDAHHMSWVAWAWVAISNDTICSYPQLITDYQGTPSQRTGQYIYQHLQSYLQ